MTPSDPRPIHNTKNIDLLRGSAAILVVLSHFEALRGIHFGWFGINGGWVGVQLFFVISGYLIIQSAYKYSAREYFIHRIFRIFPAYWFWYIVFGLLSGKLVASALADPYFYANLVMLQHFIPEAYLRYTFIPPSWTLSVEWVWYILAFLLALTSRTLILPYFLISIVVATWWAAGGVLLHPLAESLNQKDPIYVYFFLSNNLIGQLPFFLMGCVIYLYRPKLPMVPVALASVVALATFSQWSPHFPNPIFLTGLAIGGIFWTFINMKRTFHGRVVRFLSDTSYSIYLVHYLVIAYVSEHLEHKYAVVLVSLAGIFSIAYLSYRFIEKPFMRWGRQLANKGAGHPEKTPA
ncbi:acyltransferase [Ottowia sp. GY511]|uniref:Acyltransferase family protein n=1 Tax=Ottowia flava TaxID=2675430 RepID=A0ABW4KZF2_9BURK|nr:acyltransferase [Ottowia sp. GY511]TXK28548.1 acyltransferase [Ottowia sp. GY511]